MTGDGTTVANLVADTTANHVADTTDAANPAATTDRNHEATDLNRISDETTPMITVTAAIQNTDHNLETETKGNLLTTNSTKTNQDRRIKS